jgi:cytochrome P450 family 142 subfamily A polypeptide 1
MAPLASMISMDDPEHRRRRSLVNRGFTPRAVGELEPLIAGFCRAIVDEVCERGECDFVSDIAAPLPLYVIAHLLGFEHDVYDDLLRWSDDMLRATNPTAPQAVLEAGLNAALEYRDLELAVIERRRAHPEPGLITTLCQAEIDGERLDDEALVGELLLLLLGGDETTRHVLTGGMHALIEHPDQLRGLQADMSGLPKAIEELLRWVSPVKNMARTLTTDVELQGQRLEAGEQLLLFYPSANRDEAVFNEPQMLDLRRDPNPHLAFGFGPHVCLGASLARLELRCMFDEVLSRLPDLDLDDGEMPTRPSNFITGFEAMPVQFTPTARSKT